MTFMHTEPDDSQFYGHPSVPHWAVDEWGSTRCWVSDGCGTLYVREWLDCVLIDHPDGDRNVAFDTVDEAIAWALEQFGAPA